MLSVHIALLYVTEQRENSKRHQNKNEGDKSEKTKTEKKPKEANHVGEIYTKLCLTLTTAGAESDLNPPANGAWPDAGKSPMLTAQTTQPLQEKWLRGKLWCASI